MVRLIFLLLTIICYALPFVTFFNYKFGKALPLSYIVLTYLIFICSLLNNLSLIKYFVFIGELIIFLVVIWRFNKIKNNLFNNLFRFSTIFFIISFVLLFFVLKERMYVYIDDYYFWGPLVRDSIVNNALYTTKYAYAHIGTYPPFLTLLEILFCKILGFSNFVDGISMFAIVTFSLSFFMNLLDKYDLNYKSIINVLVLTLMIFGCTLFISVNADLGEYFLYNTTLIDWPMGFLFAYCMYLVFTSNNDPFDYINIGICCSALILVKQVSVPLTLLILFTYLMMLLIIKKFNKKYFVSIVIPLLAYTIWQIQVILFNKSLPLNKSLKSLGKITNISDVERAKTIVLRFIDSFFTKPITSHPINLSYFSIIAGTSLVMVLIGILKKNKRYHIISLFNFLGGIGYSLVILVSYITTFNYLEGINLACFGRYMQAYTLGSLVLLFLIIVNEICSIKKLIISLLIVCLFIEPKSINYLKSSTLEENEYYYFKNMFTNFYYYVYRGEKTTVLISSGNTGAIMIYDIAHENAGKFSVYDSYANNDSCDEFVEKLKGSKYLIVVDTNDEFWKTCNHLFQDNVIIHESIYTVNYDDNGELFLLRL